MEQNLWWLSSGPVLRITPLHDGKTFKDYTEMLPQIAKDGFKVIDVFPPYHGGVEYGGLDTIHYYETNPAVGSLSDLKTLIQSANKMDIKVIAFINVGYCAETHPDFVKACRDVKAGVESRERELFLWADAPYKMACPNAPFFKQDSSGEWVFSEAAGKYYWCKWFGMNGTVRLPQYWFGSEAWRRECAKIIQFWSEVGFDGFLVDAVNWYTGCDWEINRDVIIKPGNELRPMFLQPEGAGGFKDDPVTWIEKGGYNCLQDYALELWWENIDVIASCLKANDASALWPVIEGYRNRVVAAGGLTYVGLGQGGGIKLSPDETLFKAALLVAIGELINIDLKDWKKIGCEELSELFHKQSRLPELAPGGLRQRVEIPGKPEIFVVRCAWKENGPFLDGVFNFGETPYSYLINGRGVPIAPRGFALVSPEGVSI